MGLFNIGKQSIPTPQEEYEKMLGVEDDNITKVKEIDIELLDEIKNQEFLIHAENIPALAESISRIGVLDPVIVRAKKNGRYDIISGRHRTRACKQLKMKTIPCLIKECSVDEAQLILYSTNLNRNNNLFPSELAFGYKEQAELLKRVSSKNPSVAKIAEANNTNRRQIQRYIRLTHLSAPLLKLVDNGKIAFIAGVELSYINMTNQTEIFSYLLKHENAKITVQQATQIRNCEEENNGIITESHIENILSPVPTPSPLPLPQLEGQLPLEPQKQPVTEQPITNELVAEQQEFTAEPEEQPALQAEQTLTEINAHKAEKEKVINSNHNSSTVMALSGTAAIQAVKKHFGSNNVYSFYTFTVPTQEQSKQYLIDKFNFTKQAAIIEYQGIDCKISLDDVDKYIRLLISQSSLISKIEIIECLTKKCKELEE